MKFTTIATAQAPVVTADYTKPHGREQLTGETYTITMVRFDEIQKGKLQFAILGPEQLVKLEQVASFEEVGRNGYRSESQARKEFKAYQAPKLARW